MTGAVLCLAHLPWDDVCRCPQHIMSRLARRWPLTYVCERGIADVDVLIATFRRPGALAVPSPA